MAVHRYHGEDIHDFAWVTKPGFPRADARVRAPPLPARGDAPAVAAVDHAGQEDRHFDAAAATLINYGEWFGAYPYDNVTIVDPAFQSGAAA